LITSLFCATYGISCNLFSVNLKLWCWSGFQGEHSPVVRGLNHISGCFVVSQAHYLSYIERVPCAFHDGVSRGLSLGSAGLSFASSPASPPAAFALRPRLEPTAIPQDPGLLLLSLSVCCLAPGEPRQQSYLEVSTLFSEVWFHFSVLFLQNPELIHCSI